MRPDDGGSNRPPLPAEAGPNERTLYEVYDFQTGIVDLTASDWATSAESVRGLSADVRGIVSALRGAPDAWSGPAAEAAYQSLGKLADNLDGHAEEIDRIEAGLTSATDSATAARTAYVTTVRSVSLDVDPADYQHTPLTRPTQVSADLPTVLDRQRYDQAVAGARAAREQQAAAVLATFTDSMTTATKKLPVEPSDPADVPGGTGTPGGSGRPAGGGSRPHGSSHLPPGGAGDPGPGGRPPTDVTGGDDLPADDDTGGTDTDTGGGGGNPWPPVVDPPAPVLDGPVDGTTSPGGGSGTVGPPPGATTPGGSAGQVGPAGAAAGMGGMLAGGGAAAVLGRGGMPGGAAAARMPGSVVSTSSGGVAGRTGAAGTSNGAGRSSVLAGGGQGGAAARGSAAGRGTGVRTGRYGVPKLGEGTGGRGTVGAAGGAGSRGGTTDRDDATDVDHLTREDEETWFEGAQDATPPVWE